MLDSDIDDTGILIQQREECVAVCDAGAVGVCVHPAVGLDLALFRLYRGDQVVQKAAGVKVFPNSVLRCEFGERCLPERESG